MPTPPRIAAPESGVCPARALRGWTEKGSAGQGGGPDAVVDPRGREEAVAGPLVDRDPRLVRQQDAVPGGDVVLESAARPVIGERATLPEDPAAREQLAEEVPELGHSPIDVPLAGGLAHHAVRFELLQQSR